jgi:pyruvate formate lyase activating enzyme
LIDYPGKVAAAIFTQGCNFRCGFCHNADLIPRSEASNNKSQIPEKEVLEFLGKRVGKLDGVVITGGEPTIQPDLPDFIKKVKELGFLVKLDTNGSSPSVLSSLLSDGLLDYVAMDIKNSPNRYQETCGQNFNENITKSIKLIMASGVEYEFRTTVLPAFHDQESIEELARYIKGAKRYTLQGFRSGNVYDAGLEKAESFSRAELGELKSIAGKYVDNVQIRENI